MNHSTEPLSDAVRTVTEITRAIKRVIEPQFERVAVAGEISNFTKHTSGHLYFTLKDAQAQMSAVMFRGNAMRMFFRPQDGMAVVCRGSISVYEPRGAYQLVVTDMQPSGEGALQVAFERLKKRLFEEGLFDESRKRPLPPFPRTVALVTSPSGAAIRDIISVMQRRNPAISIVRVPVQVQGPGAAEQIVEALDLCNAYGDIDVIIVTRGGGGIEDLWAFNEEVVARAIFRSDIPVVSAVGHEIDFTIADFVADMRAATPSVAGEIVAPSMDAQRRMLASHADALQRAALSRLEHARERIRALAGAGVIRQPGDRVRRMQQMLDDVWDATQRAVLLRLERKTNALGLSRERLAAHDPARILRKGYATVMKDGRMVRSASDIDTGDALHIRFSDGTVDATATSGQRP